MNQIKIEDLNILILNNYPIKYIQKIIDNVFNISILIKSDYPDYKNWFLKKQVPGIYDGSRNIIIAHNNENILGFVSLKKDNNEKKICTFYVTKNYRKNKIGYLLAQKATEWLECDKPLITIPSDKLWDFIKISEKYNWEISDIKNGLYRTNNPEIILNGNIENNELNNTYSLKKKSIKDVWFMFYKERLFNKLFKYFRYVTK